MNQDHPKHKAVQTAIPAVLKRYDTRPRKEEWLHKIKQFYIHMVRNEAEVRVYVMLMGITMQGLCYVDGHHYARFMLCWWASLRKVYVMLIGITTQGLCYADGHHYTRFMLCWWASLCKVYVMLMGITTQGLCYADGHHYARFMLCW